MLRDFVGLTASPCGFLGEVEDEAAAEPRLRVRAVVAAPAHAASRCAAGGGSGEPRDRVVPLPALLQSPDAAAVGGASIAPAEVGLAADHPPFEALLVLPLRVGDRCVAVAGVANREGGYDAGIARSLAPLLAAAAAAIEARRLRAAAEVALRQRLEVDALVRTLARTLIQEDRDGAIEAALGQVGRFVGAQRVTYFHSFEDEAVVVRSHHWDAAEHADTPRAYPARFSRAQVDALADSIAAGQVVFLSDLRVAAASHPELIEPFLAIGARSQAWLPAHESGRLGGAVSITWIGAPARIAREHVERLSVVGDLFASALRRRRAESALRRRSQIDAFVLDLSSQLMELPIEEVDAAIESALLRIAGFAGADRAVLAEVRGSPPRLVAVRAVGLAPPPGTPMPTETELEGLPTTGPLSELRRVEVAALDSLAPDLACARAMRAIGAVRGAWLTAIERGRRAGTIFLQWRDPAAMPSLADLEALAIVADWLVAVVARQRTDLALRESEGRFRVMAESVPVMVWTTDPRGRTTFVNQRCAQFARMSAEELVRLGHIAPLHPEDVSAAGDAFREARASRKAFEIEMRAQRGDGAWRHLLACGAPLLAPDGTLRGFVGSSIDLTDHKHLEEELRQAQKLEAVGRLAGGIAHDFNNLLTVVIGHLASARDAFADGVLPERDLDEVEAAANRAASLTHQLLAFARRQHIDSRVLELNELVAGVEQLLRRLIGEHVQLEVRLGREAGCVRVDAGQLEQVLINLAVNARDAMPGGGTLRIETARARQDDRDWAQIVVSDTGKGMDDDTLAHAFEPFFTTKEVGHGTGLGLATCYGIIAQSDGHIAVHSELGVGTRFEILLPAAEPAAIEPVAGGDAAPTSGVGHETILLVEDEPSVRSLAARSLRRLGYRVLEAADGAGARDHGDTARVDLVVTDMVMPSRSGSEVARWARAQWPAARVLFISGYTDSLADDRTFSQPGFDFLPKPFTPRELALRVRALLDEPVAPA